MVRLESGESGSLFTLSPPPALGWGQGRFLRIPTSGKLKQKNRVQITEVMVHLSLEPRKPQASGPHRGSPDWMTFNFVLLRPAKLACQSHWPRTYLGPKHLYDCMRTMRPNRGRPGACHGCREQKVTRQFGRCSTSALTRHRFGAILPITAKMQHARGASA